MTTPLIVGISGATGAIYGVELLRVLKKLGQPTHLILSEMGQRTIDIETGVPLADVERRDRLDSSRRVSPLYAAADALVLDTDRLSADAVLAKLRELVSARGLDG